MYGCPVPYARLRSDQLTDPARAILGDYVLHEGTIVWVPSPGTYRSHVEVHIEAESFIQLVDNDQLDWRGPSRPELLTGLDWVVG